MHTCLHMYMNKCIHAYIAYLCLLAFCYCDKYLREIHLQREKYFGSWFYHSMVTCPHFGPVVRQNVNWRPLHLTRAKTKKRDKEEAGIPISSSRACPQ